MSSIRDSRITVIGGGAIGASVAYALAGAGYDDIQIVDTADMAAATTAQAAGLVGQPRSTVEATRASMESAEFYRRMESELGISSDWRETGSLRVALSEETAADFRRMADIAKSAGLNVEIVSGARAQELCPGLTDVSQVRLALWCPSDGFVQPNSVTGGYLAGARQLGVRVVPHTQVRELTVTDGRVTGLLTDKGQIESELVINAAGPWAGALLRTAGIELPVVPVLVQYLITADTDGWSSASPCLRIPEVQVYARGEGESLLIGGFENNGTSIAPETLSSDSTIARHENWEVLGEFVEGLSRVIPEVADLGIRTAFTGWPGFTPDGQFLIGPVDALPGLVMAAGCNAHGVQGSLHIGRHVVESLSGDVSPAVAAMSPNRFVPRTWTWEDARRSAQAICENYYPRLPQRA
ncbi:FAD-dependent oxidoreductase [Mycobacterium sp. DL99]|uniref:NAD(P)/FAD-dependent oxidoreductase n=1 Tax=Mycobacterium sp. DL99 TaxID=2528957 RepID=UPI001080CB49|nr:FAD-dependent oxidoreductase [Mycobacterium sp. DL99]